ncbi:MAG: cysteine desulfurase family protein [Candidatus Delongbacteria bacterium]
MIYLDHNASTPLAPEVKAAMLPWLDGAVGNPSSGHAFGQACRAAVELARRQLAALLGCHPYDVLFTSGGTESNNWVLQGLARRFGPCHMLVSAVEHPAVLEVCRFLAGQGVETTLLPVDEQCRVRVEDVERALRPDTRLLSVMLANNETGVLQPVAELAALCRARGILCHTDAAQVLGKLPVDVNALGVDLLSVAGHKLNAPKGVGALYLRGGVELPPLLYGAGHERGLRPGTENVLELVGLGAAARRFVEDGDGITAEQRRLRDRLEAELRARIPGLRIHGEGAERLPNTISVYLPGRRVDDRLARCPELAASAGAACHADSASPSHVLTAMGLPVEVAERTLRLSVGLGNTEEEMVQAAEMLAG